MSLRQTLQRILGSGPGRGILTSIARRPAGKRLLNAMSGSYGAFDSFAQGWSVARGTKLAGHEDPQEVTVHLKWSENLRPSDHPALAWIAKIQPHGVDVFDYGGNVGNVYYSYAPHLMGGGPIHWVVYDIPEIIASGRRIAAERGASELTFVDGLESFREEQILFISGAFHYWESDVPSFLRQFPQRPRHILINRSPVHETEASFIAVQRTPTCAFPCRVWNAKELIGAFKNEGYALADRWKANELSLKLPLFPDRWVTNYSGFYFTRV